MERMMQLLYGSGGREADSSEAAASANHTAAVPTAAASLPTAASVVDLSGESSDPSCARLPAGTGRPGGGASGFSGRDPESHRLIEKRRRDRMNGALAELCCLIPTARSKQSQGRIEKVEIIEMAIQHIITLTSLVGKYKTDSVGHQIPALCAENFQQGFLDCTRSTLSYLADTASDIKTDGLCSQLYANLHSAMRKFASAADEDDPEISKLLDSQRQQCQMPNTPDAACLSNATLRIPAADEFQYMKKSDVSVETDPKAAAVPDSESDSGSGGGSDDLHLPGFVLHPSGTHYLPLILPTLALGKDVTKRFQGGRLHESDALGGARSSPGVLHPVSIPVSFQSARLVTLAHTGKRRKRSASERWTSAADSD